jgi:hypothetical protein
MVVDRCAVDGCSAEAKVRPCDGCANAHCPVHRHPSDHGCAAAAAASTQVLAARERANSAHANAKAKADEARATADVKRAARRKKMNPKKLKSAAAISKMKMKMSATGDRNIAQESRFYLRVLLDTPTAPAAADAESISTAGFPALPLFFSCRAVVGKILDQCADKFRVSVRPGDGDGEWRWLVVTSAGVCALLTLQRSGRSACGETGFLCGFLPCPLCPVPVYSTVLKCSLQSYTPPTH